MSGINPIIDTLLHQVLGKRVDIPPPRDLNEPVRPLNPAEAPRALHSDSRLDGRPLPPPLSQAGTARESLKDTPLKPAPETPGRPAASAQSHLSGAARTIADTLLRFPSPPAAIRSPAPLLPASSPPQATPPAQLASALQTQVQQSGVFYEAHVNRWFHGDYPRDALLREPQMQAAPRLTAATLPPPAPGAAPTSPGDAPLRQLTSPLAPHAGGTGQAEALRQFAEQAWEAHSRSGATVSDMPQDEPLQGLVRQQLEMLAQPVLRWEGDIWTGIFMALVIQAPLHHGQNHGQEDDKGHEQDEPTWQSELNLELPHLGTLGVRLSLRGTQRLTMILASSAADTRDTLDAELPHLQQRLIGLGFSEVLLSVEEPEEKPDDSAAT
ncbi:flagellar hook-length control protein FliK [Halomonas marinisediminis]|uniref:Flagellar hook-length control protein FliK n=1 Tax=Halomonas marinisediminis TaxID=2546095 RepID=A0ABY2D5K3_9GAMM|nr:flagellar hook-length control protein FliK [Halomonas marinisediminis]TDB01958.1 flagellar hook-length control protein FliK [Halomonas marinisediminis]